MFIVQCSFLRGKRLPSVTGIAGNGIEVLRLDILIKIKMILIDLNGHTHHLPGILFHGFGIGAVIKITGIYFLLYMTEFAFHA